LSIIAIKNEEERDGMTAGGPSNGVLYVNREREIQIEKSEKREQVQRNK
jgi:hypothetical protein